jgi:hypothetical protein
MVGAMQRFIMNTRIHPARLANFINDVPDGTMSDFVDRRDDRESGIQDA